MLPVLTDTDTIVLILRVLTDTDTIVLKKASIVLVAG